MDDRLPIIALNLRDETPLFEQIAAQIRQNIISGMLPVGSKLPTVRELAHHWQVNFNTVARAYRILDAEGIIRSRQGQGSFVTTATENPMDPIQDREAHSILELTREITAVLRKYNCDPAQVISIIQQQFLPPARMRQKRKRKLNRIIHRRSTIQHKTQAGAIQGRKKQTRRQARWLTPQPITDFCI